MKRKNPDERIQKKIAALLKKAARGKLDIGDHLQIKSLSTLLELSNQTRDESNKINYRAIIGVAGCIVAVTLLIILRVGDIGFLGLSGNSVSLDIVARAVSLQLASENGKTINLIDDPAFTTQVGGYGATKFHASNANLLQEDKLGGISFGITGDSVFLNQVELDSICDIKITHTAGDTDISIPGSSVRGTVVFDTAKISIPGVSEEVMFNPEFPEFVYFNKDPGVADNFRIRLRSGELNLLPSKHILNPRFDSEYVEGFDVISYRSSIYAGSIQLHDIQRDITLADGERVILDGFEGIVTRLSVRDGFIHFKAIGEAKSIRTGPVNAERDQSPTLLEYISLNQPVAVFWGALVFLWTLLVGIRTTLFQKPE